jgi:Ras-related GTP-binding protein A/B
MSSSARRSKQRKVLLMGKSGAGKSSMRSIVFNNYIASDVRRLGATIDIEHSNIRFMGNLTLNLWDCGGQDAFMENYLSRQKEHVFGNVAVLIYVFDVESREFNADLIGYSRIIRAIEEFTGTGGRGKEGCRVWVLIHKMDLIDEDDRAKIFAERCNLIRKASEGYANTVQFFQTSIWDETLYRAWTHIIRNLIPNSVAIDETLQRLAQAMDARECVLYERTTCLQVAKVTRGPELENPDPNRFEGISSVLKTHKQSLA